MKSDGEEIVRLAGYWREELAAFGCSMHRALDLHNQTRERIAVSKELLANFSADFRSELRETVARFYMSYEADLYRRIERPASYLKLFALPDYISDMVQLSLKEYKAGEVRSGQHVLFIGSGALPTGMLAFVLFDRAEQLGLFDRICSLAPAYPSYTIPEELVPLLGMIADRAELSSRLKLMCVERDAEMAHLGETLIREIGATSIRSTCCDAESSPIDEPYDLILFAGIVQNKKEILDSLLCRGALRKGGRIVLRNIKEDSLGELLYEPFRRADLDFFSSKYRNLRQVASLLPAGNPAIFAVTDVLEFAK